MKTGARSGKGECLGKGVDRPVVAMVGNKTLISAKAVGGASKAVGAEDGKAVAAAGGRAVVVHRVKLVCRSSCWFTRLQSRKGIQGPTLTDWMA